MNKVLSKQQVEQYWETGFVFPVDVMDAGEAGIYRDRLEAAESSFPEHVNPENRNNAHLVLTCLDELVHHPVIVDAMEDLLGSDLALWSTVLFIKQPGSPHYVSWHQDATYMGLEPHNYATPWLALTPSNPVNGCMRMVPGSHRETIRQHQDTFHEDNILTRGQVIPDVDETQAVDLVLEPGQMSIHHPRTIHESRPNRGEDRRIGIAMQSYAGPDVRQTVVEDLWLSIRGNADGSGRKRLHRPRFDLDPAGVEDRARANENLANILYKGAARKRSY